MGPSQLHAKDTATGRPDTPVTCTGGKLDINSALTLDPTNLATGAKQDTQQTTLDSIDGKLPALGQAVAAGCVPVVLPVAQVTALTPPANPDPATQTTLAAVLAAVAAVLAALPDKAFLLPPGSHTPITPSDSTDVSAVASIGLVCMVAGDLAVRGTTTTGTTAGPYPVVAGQYVYGSFSRVMLATTATMVGLAP